MQVVAQPVAVVAVAIGEVRQSVAVGVEVEPCCGRRRSDASAEGRACAFSGGRHHEPLAGGRVDVEEVGPAVAVPVGGQRRVQRAAGRRCGTGRQLHQGAGAVRDEYAVDLDDVRAAVGVPVTHGDHGFLPQLPFRAERECVAEAVRQQRRGEEPWIAFRLVEGQRDDVGTAVAIEVGDAQVVPGYGLPDARHRPDRLRRRRERHRERVAAWRADIAAHADRRGRAGSGLGYEVGESVAVEIGGTVFAARYQARAGDREAGIGVPGHVPVAVLDHEELRAAVAREQSWNDPGRRVGDEARIEWRREACGCAEQDAPAQPAAAGVDRVQEVGDAVAVQFERHWCLAGGRNDSRVRHGLPAAGAVLVGDRRWTQAARCGALLDAAEPQPAGDGRAFVRQRIRLDRSCGADRLDRDPVELVRLAHDIARQVACRHVAGRPCGVGEIDPVERACTGCRRRIRDGSDALRAVAVRT